MKAEGKVRKIITQKEQADPPFGRETGRVRRRRGSLRPIITASTWVDPIHGNQHSWDIPIFCKKQNRPLVLKIWRKKVLKELQ